MFEINYEEEKREKEKLCSLYKSETNVCKNLRPKKKYM